MTTPNKIGQSLENFGNTLARLEEALSWPVTEANRDATILRFTLTYETAWKAIKRCLSQEEIETKYPKEALQKAYEIAWLNHEDIWIEMMKDRNIIAHVYNEDLADSLYDDIKGFVIELRNAYDLLHKKFP